jgi:hypothetical protein
VKIQTKWHAIYFDELNKKDEITLVTNAIHLLEGRVFIPVINEVREKVREDIDLIHEPIYNLYVWL